MLSHVSYLLGQVNHFFGVLVFDLAAKAHLKKIEIAQRRIILTFFKNRYEYTANLLQENIVLTLLELYIKEFVKEVSKQLRNETSQKVSPKNIAG